VCLFKISSVHVQPKLKKEDHKLEQSKILKHKRQQQGGGAKQATDKAMVITVKLGKKIISSQSIKKVERDNGSHCWLFTTRVFKSNQGKDKQSKKQLKVPNLNNVAATNKKKGHKTHEPIKHV